jgi:hypothetical protein
MYRQVHSLRATQLIEQIWLENAKEELNKELNFVRREQHDMFRRIARLDAHKQSLEIETKVVLAKFDKRLGLEQDLGEMGSSYRFQANQQRRRHARGVYTGIAALHEQRKGNR